MPEKKKSTKTGTSKKPSSEIVKKKGVRAGVVKPTASAKIQKHDRKEKEAAAVKVPEAPVEKKDETSSRYFEAVGRRKTATARVRLYTKGERGVFVNAKALETYFPTPELQGVALAALKRMKVFDKFRVMVRAFGGGLHAQAEAVRHATARALVTFNPDFRKRLKRVGYLRRDPRMVERKKYGKKKARRAPQWSKR